MTQTWQQRIRSERTTTNYRKQVKRSTAYYTEDESPFAPRPSKKARQETREEYGDDEADGTGSAGNGLEDQMAFAGGEYEEE